jgi:lysozyme
MNEKMKISPDGLDLIKKHESLMLHAYKCPGDKWTIGYGHTRTAKKGMVINEKRADQFLVSDLRFSENVVRTLPCTLSQNQFDALVSFVFNVGSGNFLTSTLRKRIIADPFDPDIARQFKRWVYAKGRKLRGLEKRRAEEAELYFKS